jgi:hypothetical protein
MQTWLFNTGAILLCLFAAGVGAAESQPFLEQRVQTLEQQVRELSERLKQMEQRPATAPKPAYAVPLDEANAPAKTLVPGWQSGEGWKKLRRGMNQIQVTQLLGNPAKRSGDRYAERWQYPDESAWVDFDQVGEVSGWKTP